jgi:DNA-binding IclR family transcriptional regulator
MNEGEETTGLDSKGQTEIPKDDGLFVASLAKGLRILECFHGRRQPLNLTEITALARIGKSAAQRAVTTLHAIGYLQRDEQTKCYKLSPKVLALCWDYLSASNIVEVAMPLVRQLSEGFGETANLLERVGEQLVVVGRSPGKQALTINVGIGTTYPLISTAPGLVLLAFSDRLSASALIRSAEHKAWTRFTVTDPNELLIWLDRIRDEGYAVADQLMHEGEISIAAPIFVGSNNYAAAAINVSVPNSRWTREAVESQLVPAVLDIAKKISAEVGASDSLQ